MKDYILKINTREDSKRSYLFLKKYNAKHISWHSDAAGLRWEFRAFEKKFNMMSNDIPNKEWCLTARGE